MPKRFQRQRTKGWRTPEGGVNCTRPGIMGNPFVCDDPADAVQAFDTWLDGGHPVGVAVVARSDWERREEVRARIKTLRGKDLGCYCALDAACHVDVILRRANVRHD